MIATTAVGLGTAGTIVYAAITGFGDWSELVVLGGIALATIGTMIAFDPLRREP